MLPKLYDHFHAKCIVTRNQRSEKLVELSLHIFQNNEQNEKKKKLQNYKRQTSHEQIQLEVNVFEVSFTRTLSVIYLFNLNVRVGILLACGKHLHDRIFH